MLADGLRRQIALDPLRPLVPVGHLTVRVEHVDGVVGDALYQQAKLLLALLEGLLGHLAIGQVTGDLGETEQGAGLAVDDRVDDHVGPEQRPVLAHPPALAFETALAQGSVQCPLRQASGAVLVGVETGKMLAEDLGLLIALEAPGTGVPTGDDARGVGHVDGIVDHGVDQQPKTLFLVDAGSLLIVLKHFWPGVRVDSSRSMVQVLPRENY